MGAVALAREELIESQGFPPEFFAGMDRVEDPIEGYERLGRAVWEDFKARLPEGWSIGRKRVLDFGCGAGRLLRHLIPEAADAELWGCDIDRSSIEWLEENLSPPLHVFVNGERPPLPHASGTLDLILAASVFTQIVEEWSSWLLELHRVLTDDGLLVASFVSTGLSFPLQNADWHDAWDDDRIGMHVLGSGTPWDEGGPVVYHSPWWIEAHWGRAFEILHLQPAGLAHPSGFGQGFAVMRKRPGSLQREDLEALEPSEPREIDALRYSLRNNRREAAFRQRESRHFAALVDSERRRLKKEVTKRRRKVEQTRRRLKREKRRRRRAKREVRAYRRSLSWRLTAPLRALVRRAAPLPGLARRLPRPDGRTAPRPEDRLEQELTTPPAWMYPWRLGRLAEPPLLDPELPSVHETRAQLIEEPVRATLTAARGEATAIDLACSEGWFSHRLLDWGAGRVVGVDLREVNIRRARLVRDHLGVSPERLDLVQRDVFDVDPAALGQFDVVLLLGLIYHVEDPVGVLRLARRLTRGVCVLETQLTRQEEPVLHGWGKADILTPAAGSFALLVESDAAENPIASGEGTVSLIPNRVAMEACVRAAGFERVEWREAAEHHNDQYRVGDRGVLVAWPS